MSPAERGVPTATVSAVVNGTAYVSPELTARVQQAVDELDYTINVVARGLQSRSTRTIGILVPNIADPVYSLMVKGVEDGLKKAGYSLVLGSSHNDPAEQSRFLERLKSKQLDGVLLLLAFGGEEELQKLVDAGQPLVFLARPPRDFAADEVVVDNVQATEMAVRYLLSGDHEEVGLIIGPRDLQISRDRIEGWRRAVRRVGKPPREELIFEGDYTAACGERAIEYYLAREEPLTAVFATSYLMMTGCLTSIRRRGLHVSEDIELMTWSESPLLDVFDPPISTIEQPSYRMGMEESKLVLARLNGDDSPHRKVVLPTELRIRRR